MESPPITFTFTTSFWTHFRATRAIVNRLWSTWVAWAFFVGVPVLCVIISLCLGQDVSAPLAFGLPTWALPAGGLLFMLGLMPFTQCLNIASLRRRNPAAGGVQTYTITPDGYSVKGNLFDSSIKWDAFHKALETREFILLYISTRWAHFIPKAATTAPQLQAIRAIIHEKLGSKAKLQIV